MHLYISTVKTFITVFHSEADDGVEYIGDEVWVDGCKIAMNIYGDTIKATDIFPYLGILLDEHGSPRAHVNNRLQALERACHSPTSGMRQPACCLVDDYRRFLVYYYGLITLM